MDSLAEALKARLKGISPEKIVFVGVGNRLRGDDAVGPAIIDLLSGKVPHAIDAGSAPENVTGAIKKLKPKAIVMIDALIFRDAPPGSVFLVESEEIAQRGFSHTLSLDFVMDYLREETGAEVFLIGVQPGYVGDREGLVPELQNATISIAADIFKALGVMG